MDCVEVMVEKDSYAKEEMCIRDSHYSEDDPGEEEPLCHDCNSRSVVQRGIQDYYYKPDPIFYRKGRRYMGVELEIDDGGESSSNAKELLSIANRSYEPVSYTQLDVYKRQSIQ